MVQNENRELREVFSCCQDPGPFGTFGQVSNFWNCCTNFWSTNIFGSSQNFGKPDEKIVGGKIDAKRVLSSDYSIDLKKD